MTEESEESNEERSISTEVEEEERVDGENEHEEDDPEEAVKLEQLEVQLEEDSDLLPSERDDDLLERHESESKEEEEGQDEDCPFCDFMRLGPCGESFSAWEACTEAAEEDRSNVFEKCNSVTGILTACMRANLTYYGPVLEAQNGKEGPSLETMKSEQNTEMKSKCTEKQEDIQEEEAVQDDDEL